MQRSCAANLAWGWCWPPGSLAEFGDDPNRYASARARKAYAGTAPITRASGLRQVVLARAVGNRRLSTACHLWAFAALTGSPGARRYYDAHRARGATHHQALRALANRLVGILHGCLRHRQPYDEQRAGRRPLPRPPEGVGWGCRGGVAPPPAWWPARSPGPRWCRWRRLSRGQGRWDGRARRLPWVRRRRRRHRPAGEVGRLPRSRLTAARAPGRRDTQPIPHLPGGPRAWERQHGPAGT
jgi:hypothetical protein